ncbi:LysR family transcriptional regulator [Litoribacter alkaliphilus]|uniref:LysR family transcriptional regulator n=1 Tax=Litoribacter ruber TaxID=702568 RepID=A0AAP2CF42_9BACT|nr:LysR substrate-binding domain-containing protein [Litoribacter alkaliphilus]MBS9523411.1 LysR family transcriptional regulator [Litoribacter alkaliphilus]
MEIRQLQYFVVLAEELHFNRAAEKLHIVQPALSKQLQQLEQELGVRLMNRTKRKVELTEAGVYFFHEAKDILHRLDKLKNQTHLVQSGEKGELKIGYVGSCIHTFLPDLLTSLNANFPQIQTYLNEMTSSAQLAALENGDLDVAFVRNPIPSPEMGERLVFSETFSLVLPHHHPAPDPPNLSELKTEKFILPPKTDGDLYYKVQLSICEDAGFLPDIAHETVHGHTVLSLVDHGLGITFLPTSFQKVTNVNVKFIELKQIPQRAEITAVWFKNNPNPSLRKFVELLI